MKGVDELIEVNATMQAKLMQNVNVIDNAPFDAAENLPLMVLTMESIFGVFCNGSIMMLFFVRPSLLKTASDLFTINLSLVDLIFSGVVLPVVVTTNLLAKSICNSGVESASNVETARNCIVLFGTVATALGTLLVSLDRGDVSLKPSKRFFTQSRAALAIGITWSIATVGLILAIIPSLLSLSETTGDAADMSSRHQLSYVMTGLGNNTTITYINKSSRTDSCCRSYPCNGTNMKACLFQLIFEILIFIAAIITIVVIYGKILWSVQRRSKRYMRNSHKHMEKDQQIASMFSFKYCNVSFCCGRQKTQDKPNSLLRKKPNTEISAVPEGNNSPKGGSNEDMVCKSKSALKYITTTIDNRKNKKQDSLEDVPFVPSTSIARTDRRGAVSNGMEEHSKNKTDFATVAMSVTVVLAIKRMAARKIKERKKKMRHLRKMTFLIIFTFLICWSPYYVTKLSIAIIMQTSNMEKLQSNTTDSFIRNIPERRCTPGWLFTWMLAIAALSCILNPALYMFSREKIRLEFMKTFFSRCSKDVKTMPKDRQPNFSSCLVCWDTEENFSEKSGRKVTSGSIFSTGWQRKNKSGTSPRIKGGESREKFHDGNATPQTISKTYLGQNDNDVRSSVRVPLCKAIPCEEETMKNDRAQADEKTQVCNELNDGLLLPPINNNRKGSFSAKSVDMLSCSTTTASIIAD